MHPKDILKRAGLPTHPSPERLAGGDMAEVWRFGAAVVKMGAQHPRQFEAEAEGLRALRDAGLPVPEVLHVETDGLVLRYLPPGPPRLEDLGNAIARLHRVEGESYGWHGPVFLGRFALEEGTRGSNWADFWRAHRINPLLRATWHQLGDLGPRIDTLLATYAPPVEGPVLLHGDLWSGNVHHSDQGPAFIDPSVWWGERGVDLAMMDLFGGFSGCMDAYQGGLPIPREVREAVPFYQLYYLLVHVHFFGGSYLNGVQRVLRTFGQ